MIDINELRHRIDWGYKVANGVVSELLNRLEAAEKERDVLRDRLALESQENGALRDSVDRACEERDALRADKATLQQMTYSLKDRLEVAEKLAAKLEEHCAVLTDALQLAIRQNSHDMLMTGDELRACEAALEETK